MDMAAMPFLYGETVEAGETFMIAVAEQCCPALIVEPLEPFALVAVFFFIVPDESEIAADDQIVFFCDLLGNIVFQQFADIDGTVDISSHVDHSLLILAP